MLKKIWCVPVATWFRPIATLAYRCSTVSYSTFVICFVSKVMPYFTSTVPCLFILGVLILFNVFDPSHCSVVTFTGCAAIWEELFCNCSKIMISYHLKYNIYRYFSSTRIPHIPNRIYLTFLFTSLKRCYFELSILFYNNVNVFTVTIASLLNKSMN